MVENLGSFLRILLISAKSEKENIKAYNKNNEIIMIIKIIIIIIKIIIKIIIMIIKLIFIMISGNKKYFH